MTKDIYSVNLTLNQEKWKAHYDKLVQRGQARASSKKEANLILGYCEKHHIIPKCMGGLDTSDNFVFLTAREHFIAHQLLAKIYPHVYGLTLACTLMCTTSTGERSNNRLYSWLRINAGELSKAKFTGKKNIGVSIALSGRTIDSHPYLINMGKINRGQTKETCESLKLMAEARTGWTKENHEGTARMAEKLTNRTSENHEGVRRGALKRKGRTKNTHEYLMEKGKLKQILTTEQQFELVQMKEDGISNAKIHQIFINRGIKLAYSTISTIYQRVKKEQIEVNK